jgi:hypothetical protein
MIRALGDPPPRIVAADPAASDIAIYNSPSKSVKISEFWMPISVDFNPAILSDMARFPGFSRCGRDA